ncbi:MAG: hypothetical protein JWP50_2692 [Phenylobacterium sp.]|nr:hypothetical protein [Phenylobacterium sp.]
MSMRGRIVEVCGRQVRRLYFRACPSDRSTPVERLSADAEPACTEAFFGLQQKGDALWAVGVQGLARIDRTGAVERTPLPPFTDYGPFAVSFASPQFALVLTEANERLSLSGAVPLMAPR